MRFRFIQGTVAMAAALSSASAAHADTFLTVEEAQQAIFPGATFIPSDFVLSPADVARLRAISQTTVFRPQIKMWKVSSGGWFFLDQVIGRSDRITYAIGIDARGALKSVEILVCDDEYDQVRNPAWRRTFVGKRFHGVHLMKEIPNLSGATLSSAHISDGVTRLLATYALFVAPRAN